MLLMMSADFFKNKLSKKNISGIPSNSLVITDLAFIVQGLILVQPLCKDYQQKLIAVTSGEMARFAY